MRATGPLSAGEEIRERAEACATRGNVPRALHLGEQILQHPEQIGSRFAVARIVAIDVFAGIAVPRSRVGLGRPVTATYAARPDHCRRIQVRQHIQIREMPIEVRVDRIDVADDADVDHPHHDDLRLDLDLDVVPRIAERVA